MTRNALHTCWNPAQRKDAQSNSLLMVSGRHEKTELFVGRIEKGEFFLKSVAAFKE
jgi:hypothetical protein